MQDSVESSGKLVEMRLRPADSTEVDRWATERSESAEVNHDKLSRLVESRPTRTFSRKPTKDENATAKTKPGLKATGAAWPAPKKSPQETDRAKKTGFVRRKRTTT